MASIYKILNCKMRVHCKDCRTNPEWRLSVGAPVKCKYGVKDDGFAEPVIMSNVDRQLEICGRCGNMDCVIKPMSDCTRKKTIKSKGFECPDKEQNHG